MLPKLYSYLILHCNVYNFRDYYVIEDLPFKLPHQHHPLLTNAHTRTHMIFIIYTSRHNLLWCSKCIV